MSQADEAREAMTCARCGRFSGPEALCAACDAARDADQERVMELKQAERFLRAAERDYDAIVRVYGVLVTEALGLNVDAVREARADVLAAHQTLELARLEHRWAMQDARERQQEDR